MFVIMWILGSITSTLKGKTIMNDLCYTAGTGFYDENGFYHEGPIECVEQFDWFSNGLVVGGIAFVILLLIAGIVYFIVKDLKRQIQVLQGDVASLKYDTTSTYNRSSLSSLLQQMKEQLNENSRDITEHDGRLGDHADRMHKLDNKIHSVLAAVAEVNRLNASRELVTLMDLVWAVMTNQTANDENDQSGTSGKDSDKESTDGTTH